MTARIRSNPWPLVAVVLGLVLAFDLGARTTLPAPALSVANANQVSIQVDVDTLAKELYVVPPGCTFVVKDMLAANTQANASKTTNVGVDIYPSLYNDFGGAAELRLSGECLMDWAKGNNNSDFGGGRNGKKANNRSQSGVVGLTGGVVFFENERVVVRNYIGPLYLDGVLIPN